MDTVMSRLRGAHHVDRDVPEFLQELRVAQTGGQVYFAFLFSVAFMPTFEQLSDGQRTLYAWALLVVALSSAVLVAPVAVHQWNFGRGLRPQWLVMTHVLALLGLALLAVGMTLGMTLVASVIAPHGEVWLPVATAAALVVCWLVLPLVVRVRGSAWPVTGVDDDADPAEKPAA
jgi:hypothetical protein